MTSFNGDYSRIKLKYNMALSTFDNDIVDVGVGLEDGTFTSYKLGLTSLDPRNRDWNKNMKASNAPFMVIDPYVDSNTNQTLVSVVIPIKNGGNFIGAVCEDISLDILQEKVKNIQYHDAGAATFMDRNGNIIATTTLDLAGVKNLKNVVDTQEHYNQIMTTPSGVFICDVGGQDFVFGYASIESTNWIIGFTVPVDTVFASLHSMRTIFLIMTIVGLILVVFFCMTFSASITKPILELENHAREFSQGNLRMQDNAFNVMTTAEHRRVQ